MSTSESNNEASLEQLLHLFRVAFNQQIISALRENLKTGRERKAYAASDGNATTREVARKAGIGSNATVANLWKRWSRAGLVEHLGGGRYKARLNLDDYAGIWEAEGSNDGR